MSGADADPEAIARAIVLRRLTLAPRTRAELTTTLDQRGVPTDVRERVLDRMTEVGLIDDDAYASAFAESRRDRGGWSRRAVRTRLRDKGVDRDTIEEALAAVSDEDEYSTAVAFLRRRWPSSARLEPQVRRRRLSAALARRGYPGPVVHRALAEVEAEAGHDADLG